MKPVSNRTLEIERSSTLVNLTDVKTLSGYERDIRFIFRNAWSRIAMQDKQATTDIAYLSLSPLSTGNLSNLQSRIPAGYVSTVPTSVTDKDAAFNFANSDGSFKCERYCPEDNSYDQRQFWEKYDKLEAMMSAVLVSMAVHPQYRGLGIGREMLYNRVITHFSDFKAMESNKLGAMTSFHILVPNENVEMNDLVQSIGFSNPIKAEFSIKKPKDSREKSKNEASEEFDYFNMNYYRCSSVAGLKIT